MRWREACGAARPALGSAKGIPAAGAEERGASFGILQQDFAPVRNLANTGQLDAAKLAGQERGLWGADGEEKFVIVAAVKSQSEGAAAVLQ